MRFIDPTTEAQMFQTASFNPMNTYLQTRNAILQNQQQAIQNQYLAPTLAQQLQGLSLQNVAQGIKNQFLPQMQQATINQLQEQVPYMQAEAGKDISMEPYYQAQANLTNQQAKYYPTYLQNQFLMGMGRYGNINQIVPTANGYVRVNKLTGQVTPITMDGNAISPFVPGMSGGGATGNISGTGLNVTGVNSLSSQSLPSSQGGINIQPQTSIAASDGGTSGLVNTINSLTQGTNNILGANNIVSSPAAPHARFNTAGSTLIDTATGNSISVPESKETSQFQNQLINGQLIAPQLQTMYQNISPFLGPGGRTAKLLNEIGQRFGYTSDAFAKFLAQTQTNIPLNADAFLKQMGLYATGENTERIQEAITPRSSDTPKTYGYRIATALANIAYRDKNYQQWLKSGIPLQGEDAPDGATILQGLTNRFYKELTVNNPNVNPTGTNASQFVRMIGPDGKRYKAPANVVNQLLSNGFQRA